MNRRVAVRGIIVDDGQLLCVKLKPYHGAQRSDFWCLPGGGVDSQEALVPALERELIEELGVAPVVGQLLFIQQFHDEHTDHLEFFFDITNAADYIDLDLANTSHGHLEIESVDFLDASKHTVLPTFLQSVDFKDYRKKPVEIVSYTN